MITIRQVDTGLYRGPQPLLAEDLYQLEALGVRTVLDLETGAHWLTDGDPLGEAVELDRFGMRAYGHPLGAILPPTIEELRSAVRFICNQKPLNPVYVHCRQGVDRTGMVCAAYRIIVNKWGVNAAIAEMHAMGFHWWYFYWTHVLNAL